MKYIWNADLYWHIIKSNGRKVLVGLLAIVFETSRPIGIVLANAFTGYC